MRLSIASCRLRLACQYLQNKPIQFNSKTSFKDGYPVSLKLIFPRAIQTCKQIQQLFIHIYKTHTGSSEKHRQTQLTLSYKTHTHKRSYLTYTMYIETCILTVSFMNKKEQYILFRHIKKKTHRTNIGTHNLHFHTKHVNKHSYLTYTMYIQACTFIDNSKHVEQERTVRLSMINIYIVI